MDANLPQVIGLLLAGGYASRMGNDKATLRYQGEDQLSRAFAKLGEVCGEAVVCIAPRQSGDALRQRFPTLVDAWPDAGPLGALATAMRRWPERAFLVLACDLPLLPVDSLRGLLAARGPQHDAVAYADPAHGGEPEPLCALYEPSLAPAVEAAMQDGRRSLLGLLRGSSVRILQASAPDALFNVNTPQEHREALDRLERDADER